MTGFVSLVGAGPGDPDLLTLKGARRLAEAQVVFHDALVPREVLDLAPRAVRFCVGKRAGSASTTQEAIERLLIRAARRGKRVVRLKGGDPFVFGRGGEEALALARAGIPFEVIPGVSSAIAAPSLAGIPVTHRGTSSGFLVLSGHSEAAYRPLLENVPPNGLTLVILMGLATRASLTRLLIDRGWRRETPAAILLAAGTRDAWRFVGELHALGTPLPEELAEAPGSIVVGDVVAIGQELARAVPESPQKAPEPAERKADVRG